MATSAGLLGAYALERNIPQSIYACARTRASILTVNITNRGGGDARVSIAITAARHVAQLSEYIEYQTLLAPKTSRERMSIFVPAGQYLTVIADTGSVSAQCWGIEQGAEDLLGPSVNTNLGLAPTFAASDLNPVVYAADSLTSVSLASVDPQELAVVHTITSGTLPAGLSLAESGLLTGAPDPTGYTLGKADETSSVTVTATNANALTASQAFSIVQKWHDGSSQALAATSAQAIYDMSSSFRGSGASAWFWIKGLGTDTSQARRMYCSMNGAGYMLWYHYRDPMSGSLTIVDPANSGTTYGLTDTVNMFMYAVPQAIVNTASYVYLNSNSDANSTTPAFADFKYAVGLNRDIASWVTTAKNQDNRWGVISIPDNRPGYQRDTVNYRYGVAIGDMQYGHNHGGSPEVDGLAFRNISGTGGYRWIASGDIWNYAGWGPIDASTPNLVNAGWGSTGIDENNWAGANRQNHIYAWLK